MSRACWRASAAAKALWASDGASSFALSGRMVIEVSFIPERRRSGCLLDRQLPQQRPQLFLEGKPAPDRAPINRPAHLQRARSLDRPLVLVECEASGIPLQAAVVDDVARLGLEVLHH